jgi:hypothetical protein
VGSAARRALDSAGGAWDMGKMTRGQYEAAPTGEGTRGAVAGEVLGSGALGWLRERTSSECPPGARRCASPQNTVDGVQ